MISTTGHTLLTRRCADSHFAAVDFVWWLMHMAPRGELANDNEYEPEDGMWMR